MEHAADITAADSHFARTMAQITVVDADHGYAFFNDQPNNEAKSGWGRARHLLNAHSKVPFLFLPPYLPFTY